MRDGLRRLGRAADLIFLMTYEWGYSYGPPMAISPIRSMRTVIEYALKEIPAEKLLLGIPNYGYDWQIPYSQSRKAVSISNQYAVSLAARYYAAIRSTSRSRPPGSGTWTSGDRSTRSGSRMPAASGPS